MGTYLRSVTWTQLLGESNFGGAAQSFVMCGPPQLPHVGVPLG